MRGAFVGLLLVGAAFAGETGKVAGRVFDRATGEVLAGASVVLLGTELGAATGADGSYAILAVPAGTYSVEASAIGYRAVEVTGERVEPDRTTRVDFHLEVTSIEMPKVTVQAERPMVTKEMVAPRYSVQARDMKFLPSDYVEQLVKFSAGVAQTESTMHVRGGRASEVDYLIDGVSVVDPLTGEFGVNVSKGVADEVIFMPGGFSAEYGRAMSGVVNLVTVNPKPQPSVEYTIKSEEPMPWYYDFGYTDQALKFHLPIGPSFRTVAVASINTTDDWDPRLFKLPHKGRADYSLYGKALYDVAGKFRFSLSGVAARSQYERYKSDWKLILDNYRSDLRHGSLVTGAATWMPTSRAFARLTLSRFDTDKTYGKREPGGVSLWKDFGFVDTSAYVAPGIDFNNPWGCRWDRWWYFKTYGDYEEYRKTRVGVWNAKLSGNAQVTRSHQFQAGLTGDFYDVHSEWNRWPAWYPVLDTYTVKPTMLAAYVQDRIEYEGLYADIGLRYDRFASNGTFPDTTDPTTEDFLDTATVKSQVSPRIGASFRIADWLFARANFGYYFGMPQFAELYDNSVDPAKYRTQPGDYEALIVGNPDLSPEKTQSYEIGLQGQVTKNLALTANLWRKDVQGLVGTADVPSLPLPYATYFNDEYAKLTGVEFIADVGTRWVSTKVSYTLSFARGTSSHANELYWEFIRQGRTVPIVEHPLDFDQRNRAFLQVDVHPPDDPTGAKWLDAVLDSLQVHVLGYVGNGYPYSPPGGKGDSKTWNTQQGPIRSNLDMVVNKPLRFGKVKVDLVAEVLNLLDIRDVLYVYPQTGRPDDDGNPVDWYDPTFSQRPDTLSSWFGSPRYSPARDFNHDGYVTNWEEYMSTYYYHQATVDWVNNYGPPRRARLGFTVGF